MEILHGLEALSGLGRPAHLAIGVFDGIHLGHAAVIREAVESAARDDDPEAVAVVVTFDPHPVRILQPENAPRLLTSTKHKIELLKQLEVGHLLIINFDDAFSALSGEAFIEALVEAGAPLRRVCVGREWTFGHRRSGNIALLEDLAVKHGFEVSGVPAVTVDGEVVSSTVIRHAVEEGDFDRAAIFLGREYTVLGTVIEGEKLGRKLGFPTANLTVHNEQLPPSGVYVVRAELEGTTLHGVGNLGVRPTVTGGESKRMLEIHLFDHEGDLYGADLEVHFLKFLRPETKFENVHALSEQIAKDVAEARAFLK